MIPTTLVVGGRAYERELAIAQTLAATESADASKISVLLEGLSDGKVLLTPNDNLIISRIAAGCLCCSNNMIMRIYLNRLIQQKPQQLFISLSTGTHLERILQFLSATGYENVLEVPKVLSLNSTNS